MSARSVLLICRVQSCIGPCQVSAREKISKWVELVVVQPQVKILGTII